MRATPEVVENISNAIPGCDELWREWRHGRIRWDDMLEAMLCIAAEHYLAMREEVRIARMATTAMSPKTEIRAGRAEVPAGQVRKWRGGDVAVAAVDLAAPERGMIFKAPDGWPFEDAPPVPLEEQAGYKLGKRMAARYEQAALDVIAERMVGRPAAANANADCAVCFGSGFIGGIGAPCSRGCPAKG